MAIKFFVGLEIAIKNSQRSFIFSLCDMAATLLQSTARQSEGKSSVKVCVIHSRTDKFAFQIVMTGSSN